MSMLASAIPSLSIAQKLAIIPLVPKRHLISTDIPFPFLIENPTLFLSMDPDAMSRAKKFLKNAFCIVGSSPEILTKKVIREKKNAASSKCIIALCIFVPIGGTVFSLISVCIIRDYTLFEKGFPYCLLW